MLIEIISSEKTRWERRVKRGYFEEDSGQITVTGFRALRKWSRITKSSLAGFQRSPIKLRTDWFEPALVVL